MPSHARMCPKFFHTLCIAPESPSVRVDEIGGDLLEMLDGKRRLMRAAGQRFLECVPTGEAALSRERELHVAQR